MGLTIPEWVFLMLPFPAYTILLGNGLLKVLPFHIILILLYGAFVSTLEENIIMVLIRNMRIKGIVLGVFKKPLPIYQIRSEKIAGLGNE